MFRRTRVSRRAVMVVGAVTNAAPTPQASYGHIGVVRSILSASPCAVPMSSHVDWCLSELRIRIFSRTTPTYFLHVPSRRGGELARA